MSAMSAAPTGEFFQLGYVTRDLDRAVKLYRDRYGVGEFRLINTRDLAPPGAAGPFMEIGLAYRGDIMIELIQPDPLAPGIYAEALRDDGGVNLHHLGYLVDQATFATLADDLKGRGFVVPLEIKAPAATSFLYADTRSDNGLFSEFVCPGEGGAKLFASLPRF